MENTPECDFDTPAQEKTVAVISRSDALLRRRQAGANAPAPPVVIIFLLERRTGPGRRRTKNG
ncbi:MAG: hypothetical protein ACLVAA_01030 [Ruthenibacterium sp.]